MKVFVLLFSLMLLVDYSYAQQKPFADYSNIITTKKILLKYNDNKMDSLMIPVVSDNYPELKKALCDTNLFLGDQLDSVVHRYQTEGTGITSFDYEVTFAGKGVISLRLYCETMGAHPDQSTQWLTLNTRTGTAYPLSAEINQAGLTWIYASYKALLKKHIADDKSGVDAAKQKKDDDSDVKEGYIVKDENTDDIYDELMRSVNDLTIEELLTHYVFTSKGIIFTTERVLPHAVANFEPQRDWFIPYSKLKRFVLPNAIVLK